MVKFYTHFFVIKCTKILVAAFMMFGLAMGNSSASEKVYRSIHAGFLYPSGVDLFGYTAENLLGANVYGYYTFGIPSIAAIGINYYENYDDSGMNGTLGIGVGSVLYGSIAYRLRVHRLWYMRIGAGVTTSIVYNGLFPIIAFENRF